MTNLKYCHPMQRSEYFDMQSDMQVNIENETHFNNATNTLSRDVHTSKLERTYQVYNVKPKGQDVQNCQKDVKKIDRFRGDSYPRASTPCGIDLPDSSVDIEDENRPLVTLSTRTGFFPPTSIASLESSETEFRSHIPDFESETESEFHDFTYSVDDTCRQTESESLNKVGIKNRSLTSFGKEKNKGSIKQRSRKRIISKNNDEDTKIKRPQHHVLGFMEDYAEFGPDWEETGNQGSKMPSVLESTVDGSIIKGARRRTGQRRMTQAEFTSCINSAIEEGDIDEDPLKVLDDWGLKSEDHKYKCSSCDEFSHRRRDIEKHIGKCTDIFHSDAVVVVLFGSSARGKTCSLCNVRLHRTEYFKHMREEHKDDFPLHCGYCAFRGQDYNQLQHHIRKKHNTSEYDIINILKVSSWPPTYSETLHKDVTDDVSDTQQFICPICKKDFKTLQTLKKHVMQHSRQKRQCVICSFTTNFPTQIKSHYQRKHPNETPKWKKVFVDKSEGDLLVEDAAPYLKMVATKYGIQKPKETKSVRLYKCPHCEYTCHFNSSYNRHLNIHKGDKPFKCGYCDYHARESYVVNKHCRKVHKDKPSWVEIDKNFKSPYRYAKKMKTDTVALEELPKPIRKRAHSYGEESKLDVWAKQNKKQVKDFDKGSLTRPQSNDKSRLIDKTEDDHIKNGPRQQKEERDSRELDKITEELLIEQSLVSSVRRESESTDGRKNHVSVASLPQEISIVDIHKDMVPEKSLEHQNDSLVSEIVKTVVESSDVKGDFNERDFTVLEISQMQTNIDQRHESENFPKGTLEPDNNILRNTQFTQEPRQTIKVKSFYSSTNIKRPVNCKPLDIHSILENKNSYDNSFDMQFSSCDNVLIQLYASDLGSPIEIILNNSSERFEDGYATQEAVCVVNESEMTAESPNDFIHSSVISNNSGVAQISPEEKLSCEPVDIGSVALAKENTGEDGMCILKFQNPLEPRPTQGLESTLRDHITFLSDSLSHRDSVRTPTVTKMSKDLLGLEYSNSDYFSSEKIKTMMIKTGSRAKCQVCGLSTTYRAFYKHAKKHFNIKPFKCGYCTYRSIEKSKIRVHSAFCHPSKPCIVMKLSPENACLDDKASESLPNCISACKEEPSSKADGNETENYGISSDPIQNIGETLLNNQQEGDRSKSVSVKTTRQFSTFQCSICGKVLKNHSPSVRRHLFSHYGYKPYKCGYCEFTAVAKSEIRSHHSKHLSVGPPKIDNVDVPMPAGLTKHMKILNEQHRVNRRNLKKKELDSQPTLILNKNSTDILWPEPEASREEDLTAMYLSAGDTSQQGLVTDDHHELQKALGVETCSLQQTLDSVVFNTEEAKYSIEVLESDGQSSRFPVTYLEN